MVMPPVGENQNRRSGGDPSREPRMLSKFVAHPTTQDLLSEQRKRRRSSKLAPVDRTGIGSASPPTRAPSLLISHRNWIDPVFARFGVASRFHEGWTPICNNPEVSRIRSRGRREPSIFAPEEVEVFKILFDRQCSIYIITVTAHEAGAYDSELFEFSPTRDTNRWRPLGSDPPRMSQRGRARRSGGLKTGKRSQRTSRLCSTG
jgi:hypothetical protein